MRIAFSVVLEVNSGQVLALATFADMEKEAAAMAGWRSLLKASVDFVPAFEETTDLAVDHEILADQEIQFAALMDEADQAALFDASKAESGTLFDMEIQFAALPNRPHGLEALADR